MTERCVILTGGVITDLAFCRSLIRPEDFLICADKGLRYALQMGLEPDLAVGDFDSFRLPENLCCETVCLPAQKDDTDTLYAVRQAISRGYGEILLLGATGGRADHFLGNIQVMLFAKKQGCDLVMRDEQQTMHILRGGETICIAAEEGKTFSLLAVSPTVSGVTLTGAKYPLCDALLTADFPLGISNEIVGQTAEITLKEGFLLLLQNQKL